MSGTNQAVNLTGMLTNMANSIGAMPDISGLTANIQGMTQPTLNANDPDSLEKYAKWAESTGKREEAAEYRKQAAQLRRERNTVGLAKEAIQASTLGTTAAQQGDVSGVQQQIKELKTKLGKATTTEQIGALRSEISRLEGQVPAAQRTQQNNKLAGVFKLEELVASGQLTQEQEANAQRQLDRLLVDPNVSKEYTNAKLQRQQAEAAQMRIQAEQESQQINQQAFSVITSYGVDSPEFEALKETPLFQKNGPIVRAIEAREIQLSETKKKREQQMADSAVPPDISFADTLMEHEAVSDSPELQVLHKKIKTQLESKGDGLWLPSEKKTLQQNITKLERAANQKITIAESAQAAQEQAYADALNRAKTNKVTETEIKNWQSANDPWGPLNRPDREAAIQGVLQERVRAVQEVYGRADDPTAISAENPDGNDSQGNVPQGVTAEEWEAMTPEEREPWL